MGNVNTKQCPFCREEIKFDAVKCRFCGEFLENDTSQGVIDTLWNGLMGFIDSVGSLLKVVLYLIPLAMIGMCGYCVFSTGGSSTQSSIPVDQDTLGLTRSEIIHDRFRSSGVTHVLFERLIKENMNDPSSYQFVASSYKDSGEYIDLTIQYRGKNAFGARVLESLTARFDIDGDFIKIVD